MPRDPFEKDFLGRLLQLVPELPAFALQALELSLGNNHGNKYTVWEVEEKKIRVLVNLNFKFDLLANQPNKLHRWSA